MAKKQFSFIQTLPGGPKREQELERAKALSHAAKVTHERAKAAERADHELVVVLARRNNGTGALLAGDRASFVCPRDRDSLAGKTDDRFEKNVAWQYGLKPQSRWEVVAWRGLTQRPSRPIPAFLSLQQGGSDPFGVSAIPITSTVNLLMTYTRELYLPAMSQDVTKPDSKYKHQDWEDCVDALKDKCTAYAHLARIAAAVDPLDNNYGLVQQALVFKQRGKNLLRARIHQAVMDHKTQYAIFCLLQAEIYSRDFAAARSHAKMLVQILQRPGVAVDYEFLHSVLRHDSNLTAMSLTRSSFDMEVWIPETFAPCFKPLMDALPERLSIESMSTVLDKDIDNDRLRDIFSRLRQASAIFLVGVLGGGDPAYSRFDLSFFIRHVVFWSTARLVNHCLDAESRLLSLVCDSSQHASIASEAHMQAQAGFSALLWIRNYTGVNAIKVAGAKILFDADKLLMSRLRSHLSGSESLLCQGRQKEYGNLRLWSLYIGAYLDQVEAVSRGANRNASRSWFNVKLIQQAGSMGINSWPQVQQRLLGFLYTDVMQPHGSTWFLADRNVFEL